MQHAITSRLRQIAALMVLLPSIMSAQTQQGYVKTCGRAEAPGKALSGVLIKVAEVPNQMVSSDKGMFSFPLKGDRFRLSSIRKNGYVLTDQEMTGRLFPMSPTVPLQVTMVSTSQLRADKKRIEDKAYQQAAREYEQRIAALEQQLNDQHLSRQEAERQRLTLGNNYQRFVSLIDRMAERYAKTDYDGMEQLNRQIMQCLEHSDSRQAAQLMNSKQSLDGNDLYLKHLIYTATYANDSAAACLEQRAMLDTTDISLLIQAADFVYEYSADYNRVLSMLQTARRRTVQMHGEDCVEMAVCDNRIAKTLIANGQYMKAMEFLYHAGNIFAMPDMTNTDEQARCCILQATIHNRNNNYALASKLLHDAVSVIDASSDSHLPVYIDAVNQLSLSYLYQGKSDEALRLIGHIQALTDSLSGGNMPEMARQYLLLGIAYSQKRQYANGNRYLNKALDIWQKSLGDSHPYIASVYDAKADIALREACDPTLMEQMQANAERAMTYRRKALDINSHVYGSRSPMIADGLIGLAKVLYYVHHYGEAVAAGMKALQLLSPLGDMKERELANLYQQLDVWWKTLFDNGLMEDKAIRQQYAAYQSQRNTFANGLHVTVKSRPVYASNIDH